MPPTPNKTRHLLLVLLLLSSLLVACNSSTGSTGVATPGSSTPAKAIVASPAGINVAAIQNAAAKLDPVKELNEPDYTFTTQNGPSVRPNSANSNGSALTDLSVSTIITDKAVVISGTLEGGNFYLHFPAAWNGELVLFAHGYEQPATPSGAGFGGGNNANTPPPRPEFELSSGNPAIKALFQNISQSYAYGFSSYAKPRGYSVKSGIESTRLLKRLAETLVPVKRTYIVGESMGGDVLMGLIEKYPNDYAGALSTCGVVAGWSEEDRFISDFRVVYDYFTKPFGSPIALPGAGTLDPLKSNPQYTPGAIYNSLNSLFTRVPNDPAAAKAVKQIAKVTGANPDLVSFLTLLFAANPDTQDISLTTGGNGYSNLDKIYKGSDDDKALNAGVQRITAQPAATAYLNKWYTPQGDFKTKLLTVHNTIDPLVPFEFEGLLKAQVVAKANAQNLAQQVVDGKPVNPATPFAGGPAHCYFSANQLIFAWNNLQKWVENGTKPQDGLNITEK